MGIILSTNMDLHKSCDRIGHKKVLDHFARDRPFFLDLVPILYRTDTKIVLHTDEARLLNMDTCIDLKKV